MYVVAEVASKLQDVAIVASFLIPYGLWKDRIVSLALHLRLGRNEKQKNHRTRISDRPIETSVSVSCHHLNAHIPRNEIIIIIIIIVIIIIIIIIIIIFILLYNWPVTTKVSKAGETNPVSMVSELGSCSVFGSPFKKATIFKGSVFTAGCSSDKGSKRCPIDAYSLEVRY